MTSYICLSIGAIGDDSELREFLRDINAYLRKLDLEVKKGIEEDTGKPCYVFINSVESDFLQSAGKYTSRQMEFFKVLVRYGCSNTMLCIVYSMLCLIYIILMLIYTILCLL